MQAAEPAVDLVRRGRVAGKRPQAAARRCCLSVRIQGRGPELSGVPASDSALSRNAQCWRSSLLIWTLELVGGFWLHFHRNGLALHIGEDTANRDFAARTGA